MYNYEYDLIEDRGDNLLMKTIMKKNIVVLLIVGLSVGLGSCASKSRPTLYPNEVLREKGAANAEADINQCMKDAEAYLKTPEGKKVAHGGSFGTGVGIGTSVGIGSGGTGVGVGVGVGGGNRVSGLDVKKIFVNQCLAEKGYQVLAWD